MFQCVAWRASREGRKGRKVRDLEQWFRYSGQEEGIMWRETGTKQNRVGGSTDEEVG